MRQQLDGDPASGPGVWGSSGKRLLTLVRIITGWGGMNSLAFQLRHTVLSSATEVNTANTGACLKESFQRLLLIHYQDFKRFQKKTGLGVDLPHASQAFIPLHGGKGPRPQPPAFSL